MKRIISLLCVMLVVISASVVEAKGKKKKKHRKKSISKVKSLVNVGFSHQYPCNLFKPGKEVTFNAKIKPSISGPTKINWTLTNYFKEELVKGSKDVEFKKGKAQSLPFAFKGLDKGFYVLNLKMQTQTGGKQVKTNKSVTFGVTEFLNRTRQEALKQGSRFGMRNRKRDYEGMDACIKLGLQWDRDDIFHPFTVVSKDGKYDWTKADEMVKKGFIDRQLNLIYKLEGFPYNAYDEKRYGPMDDYRDPHQKGHGWRKTTRPKEKEYKAWVQQVIKHLPPGQKHYEIWNEPWGKMPQKDFADICNWAVEAIKEKKPDAIVGPDLGHIAYDMDVAKYGGFDKIDMVTIHPYSGGKSPEAGGIRSKIRDYRKFLKEKTGRDFDLYSTEWGFRTDKKDKNELGKSAIIQAQYTVREGLGLYAEDIKALIPWVMRHVESPSKPITFHGFIHKDYTPKPVLLAYANLARVIDCSKFVGDLWLGEQIGAMLFARKGIYTAALWVDNEPKTITFDPGVKTVKMIDIMGRSKQVKVPAGGLKIKLSGDPVYLVGVSPKLANDVVKIDLKKRWPSQQIENIRTAGYMKKPAKVDGVLGKGEWDDCLKFEIGNKKVKKTGTVYVGWDEQNLSIFVDIIDRDPMNNPYKGMGIYQGDSIELFISSKPERRVIDQVNNFDYQLVMCPKNEYGKPDYVFVRMGIQMNKKLVDTKIAYAKTDKGWAAEIVIPFKKNFPEATQWEDGGSIALDVVVNDRNDNNSRITNKDPKNTYRKWHLNAGAWSGLKLKK